MAEGKKSFLLYTDLIHVVSKLTDEEAGRLFKHTLEYVNDLDPNPPDRITELLFEPIKLSLKRDLVKWEDKINSFSEAGKESAKARRLISATQLYILRFYDDNEEFIKVGITDNSIGRRYSSSGEGGNKHGYKFDIVYQYFQTENGVKVIDLEKDIINTFSKYRYEPKRKFGGHLECYSLNALEKIEHRLTSFNIVQQDTTDSTVNDNVNVNDSVIKIKYVYSQFYDEELQKSNNDQNYLKFIKFLFGENELSRPLTAVLKLKDQMRYDQFLKLREQSIKYNVNIYPTILDLENNKKCKDYTVLYTTLKNWTTPKK